MLFKQLAVGPLQTNCYILGCRETNEAIIVDPGGDFDLIEKAISKLNLKPVVVVNTHAHIDHIGAVEECKSHYGIKFGLCEKDLPVLKTAPDAAAMFGLGDIAVPEVDFYLKDGDTVKAGGISFKVINTPGHTKGSVCFFGENILISGDTLFSGSIGRTDLPGGSYKEIISSVVKKLLPLGDGVKVYPGHGDSSTIGEEKLNNPYLNEARENL